MNRTIHALFTCLIIATIISSVLPPNVKADSCPGGYLLDSDINVCFKGVTDETTCKPPDYPGTPAGKPGTCILAIIPSEEKINSPVEKAGKFITSYQLPTQIINKFLPIILTIFGFMAVVFIIISGIQYITSSGNPEATKAAQGRLMYAIVGFIIIVLAFAFAQIVTKIFLGVGI